MKRALVIFLFVILLAGVGAVFFAPPFERKPPKVQLPPQGTFIKAKSAIGISLEDRPAGLREVTVRLLQGAHQWNLLAKIFPVGTYYARLSVVVEPKKLGIKEGPALLEVVAGDRSLWNLGKGNVAKTTLRVKVDYTPPRVELLDNTLYVYENGAGAVLFQTSEDAADAAVQVPGIHIEFHMPARHFIDPEGQGLQVFQGLGPPSKEIETHTPDPSISQSQNLFVRGGGPEIHHPNKTLAQGSQGIQEIGVVEGLE